MSERSPGLHPVDVALRSPRGLLVLLSLTFGGALVLAVVMATNRWFFEKYVRESVAEPPPEIKTLAREIDSGEAPESRIEALDAIKRAALYDAWLTGNETPGSSRLPRALARAAPDLVRARLERTLVAGSTAQRLRAIELARAAGTPESREALEWALARARSMRQAELALAIEGALASPARGD